MPQAKSKKPRKPVKFTTYKQNYGVKECMHWPDPSAKLEVVGPSVGTTHKLVPKKGDVGKPLDRGFDLSGLDHQPPRNPQEEDHVLDALRGWPHKAGMGPEGVEEDPYGLYARTVLEVEAEQRKQQIAKKKAGKNKKTGSQKCRKKSGLEGSDGPDPHMGDLISHRFMIEAVRARQEQREQEERAELQRRKTEWEKKFPKDIKATKASQLRSIAQAERVGMDARQLWQMGRFQNVPSHLDTFRAASSSNKVKATAEKHHQPSSSPYGTGGGGRDYSGGDNSPRYTRQEVGDKEEPELNFTTSDVVYEYGHFDANAPLMTQQYRAEEVAL